MSIYIDVDVARRIINSPRSKEQMLLVLSQAEPADVKPVVRGEWIKHNSYGREYLECPFCKCYFLHEHLVRNSYCPNCGADMRPRLQGTEIDGMYIDISGDGTVVEQI